MLYRFCSGDANMRSVWICSRNDAIGNVAVVLAAASVLGTRTAWPDLIVAGVMATLGISGGVQIVRRTPGEIRRYRQLVLTVRAPFAEGADAGVMRPRESRTAAALLPRPPTRPQRAAKTSSAPCSRAIESTSASPSPAPGVLAIDYSQQPRTAPPTAPIRVAATLPRHTMRAQIRPIRVDIDCRSGIRIDVVIALLLRRSSLRHVGKRRFFEGMEQERARLRAKEH